LPCCLDSLRSQHEAAEVIVVGDVSGVCAGDEVLIPAPPDTLTPRLWKTGLDRARAPIVAFLSAECVPGPGWIARIREVLARRPEAAAVGGPIDAPDGGSVLDAAYHLSRFSSFLPGRARPDGTELAGDNVAYRREALEGCAAELADGFWETLVNERLRKSGALLAWDDALRVRVATGAGRFAFAGQRFRHGRHYGRTRPHPSRAVHLARALTVPLLVPVLAARIARRSRDAGLSRTYARALPGLLVFLAAWSAGEGAGLLGSFRHARP
jgi:hypothetical protein